MNAIDPDTTCNVVVNVEINKNFDFNQLHKGFGHCGFETLWSTAKIHNLTICAIVKANQKTVNKVWFGSSNIPGERIYINISSIKVTSLGGAKFWALAVDDFALC
jgi:hypothetical protein